MTTMMECGHAAQAEDSEGEPVCAICVGRKPEARMVAKSEPDLTGRMATCGGAQLRRKCRGPVPSATGLAFFGHRPAAETDTFYCGCDGWD